MGKTASNADRSVLKAISQWKISASEEIDTIGGWRRRPDVYFRLHAGTEQEQRRERSEFFRWTAAITERIASHGYGLESRSVMDVHEVIATWSEEKSVDRLPTQSRLNVMLEQAIFVVNAIEHAILEKGPEVASPSASPREALGEFIRDQYASNVELKKIATAVDDDGRWGKGWDSDRVGKELTRYLKRHPEIHIEKRKPRRNRQSPV
jgi:hypothetical protein